MHIDDGKTLPITQSPQDCASVRMCATYKSRAILEGSSRHLEFFRSEKLHPEGAQSPRVRLRRYLMKLPLHVCVATTRWWQKHCVMSSNRSAKANKPTEIPKNRLCIDSCLQLCEIAWLVAKRRDELLINDQHVCCVALLAGAF